MKIKEFFKSVFKRKKNEVKEEIPKQSIEITNVRGNVTAENKHSEVIG